MGNRYNSSFPLTRYERITEVDFSLCEPKETSCGRMSCPEEEEGEGEEVCGNDGVTYKSACHLRKATCTSGERERQKFGLNLQITLAKGAEI